MDVLSTEQRGALERALHELQQAGLGHLLQPSMLLPTATSASASALPSLSSSARPTAAMEHLLSDPTPTGLFSASGTFSAPAKLLCSPAPARPFTAAEKAANGNVIHRKARADALAIHPPQTTVEYPETGLLMGQRIAHLFSVNPDRYVNPRHSFQFSFDKGHGGQASATCLLLTDANGSSISCSEWHGTCSSVKTCSFAPIASDAPPPRIPALPTFDDAEKRLFLSSFGFYCALLNRGCTFSSASGHAEDQSDAGDCEDFSAANQEDHPLAGDAASRGPRAPSRSTCSGKLCLWANDDGKYFVSCSLRKQGARGHLFLYGVEQYDVGYLKALFSDDHDSALAWERRAEQGGYGPLARCNRLASPSSQAYWSDWHRRPGFALERALMVAHSDCPAKCEVFVPHDLQLCPSVLVVCSNPHSHPLPPPTKTPPLVRRMFEGMLRSLDWQMADITPRRLVLNSRFMHHLRTALGWSQYRNPQLSDLHPSLGNFDHTSYLIELVRNEVFPKGTGFNASVYQLVRETSLGRSERYVRVAESAQVNGATFRFVICMYPEQSEILRQAKRLTADAAFKRVVGWKEFELETWDDSGLRSITCARVFMTALSADAHLIVLKRIYQLVLEDCGAPWQFAYLHGAGTDTATSDQDNAEALAFGKFAQWIASSTLAPSDVFCTLTPYQHLAHFYTLCLTHHKRNLTPYKNKVTPSVFHAMQSLASAEPLPDIDAVIATIRAGGKAAADWIDNKLVGDSWALRALYQPWSKIPLPKWKAAPRTTNGNEQAHHNVNLDGTRLSLLAGVMHGAEFDRRVLEGRRAVAETGVQTRFKVSDEFHRAERRLTRQVRVNDKILAISDAALEMEHAALQRLDEQKQRQVNILATVSASSTTASSARKRLREISEQLPQQEDRLRKAAKLGSGRVVYDDPRRSPLDPSLLRSPQIPAAPLPRATKQPLYRDASFARTVFAEPAAIAQHEYGPPASSRSTLYAPGYNTIPDPTSPHNRYAQYGASYDTASSSSWPLSTQSPLAIPSSHSNDLSPLSPACYPVHFPSHNFRSRSPRSHMLSQSQLLSQSHASSHPSHRMPASFYPNQSAHNVQSSLQHSYSVPIASSSTSHYDSSSQSNVFSHAHDSARQSPNHLPAFYPPSAVPFR